MKTFNRWISFAIFEANLNETLSTLGFKSFGSDVVETALKSHDYDADEALLYLIEIQEKVDLFQKNIHWL